MKIKLSYKNLFCLFLVYFYSLITAKISGMESLFNTQERIYILLVLSLFWIIPLIIIRKEILEALIVIIFKKEVNENVIIRK